MNTYLSDSDRGILGSLRSHPSVWRVVRRFSVATRRQRRFGPGDRRYERNLPRDYSRVGIVFVH